MSITADLTDEQISQILWHSLNDAGDEGCTETELQRIAAWIAQVQIDAALLELLLDGKIKTRWRDGEEQMFASVDA